MPIVAAQEDHSNQETAQGKKAGEGYELETITVTAQKREENIQEVPLSVTALSEIPLEDAGIEDIMDLSYYVPNLFLVTSGNRNEPTPIIRGMYNFMSINPTVGMYVDGVSYSRHQAYDLDLVCIERIEVLKGPQGTLFGRNTEAGAINIVTKQPGDIWEGKVSAGYGNYSTRNYSFSVSGPLAQDKLSFGISGKRFLSDGYFENEYLGIDDVERRDDLSGRATLIWTPTDAWDITLRANATQYEGGMFSFTPLDSPSHTVSLDYDGDLTNDANSGSLTLNHEGSRFDFISITAFRDGDYAIKYDVDSSPYDLLRNYYAQNQDLASQEIRFASPENSGALKWLVGFYYLNEEFDVDNTFDYRQGYPEFGIPKYKTTMASQLNTENYAVFGQATYTFREKLGLTAGMRYENDQKEFKAVQHDEPDALGMGTITVENDDSLEIWLPKFTIDYRYTGDVMAYVSIAKGYTAGGFNNLDPSVLGVPYDAEFSWNYEAGVKTTWLDNKVNLNFAAFYIDWTDKQVFEATSVIGSLYTNAAEATIKGFEVEAQARLSRGLEVVGSFGYIDTEYGTYKEPIYDPISGAQIGEADYEGKQLIIAPEFNYNLAAQYRYPLSSSGTLFSRIELQGVGDYYYDKENTVKQSSYNLINARLGYEGEHKGYGFSLYLWAKNILDEEYTTAAFGSPGLGWNGRVGDPQTFGITLTARF